MATLSGTLLFNIINSAPTTGTGVSNIPIVLRSNGSNLGVVVLTDCTGNYTITDVPPGNYTLVEAYGTLGGILTPVSFNTASLLPAPIPNDPPLYLMPFPPAAANGVQSLSPNTLNFTVSANLSGLNFVDGPLTLVPAAKAGVTPLGPNLIFEAASGTFGALPPGTPADSSPPVGFEPYPLSSKFVYNQISPTSPGPNQYTISNLNLLNIFSSSWWNMADLTSRDETGRSMIVNTLLQGLVVFTQAVNVKPKTYYCLNMWLSNLFNCLGKPTPKLGVRVKTGTGAVIFDQPVATPNVSLLPTWFETSTIFNSQNNILINVEVYNQSPFQSAFALDDISLYEVTIFNSLTQRKTVNKSYALLGYSLTYNVTLTNSGGTTITNMIFSDTIPEGTIFTPGSVTINNSSYGGLNPTPPGFKIPYPTTLAPGQSVNVGFSVTVVSVPVGGVALNRSLTNYLFDPVGNGVNLSEVSISNQVSTTIFNTSRGIEFV